MTISTSKHDRLNAIETRMVELKGRIDRIKHSNATGDLRRFLDYLKAYEQLDAEYNTISKAE